MKKLMHSSIDEDIVFKCKLEKTHIYISDIMSEMTHICKIMSTQWKLPKDQDLFSCL